MPNQCIDGLHRIPNLQWAVARIMIKITSPLDALYRDSLFQKILMDVDQTTAREDLLEFIAIKLIEAGAAADHDGFDVEVVECIGDPVEKDPIVRGDFFSLVILAGRTLGVAAAQISWRQHRLNAYVIKHGLRCQPDLREKALRATAGEIENGLCLNPSDFRVPNDRDNLIVFNVQ